MIVMLIMGSIYLNQTRHMINKITTTQEEKIVMGVYVLNDSGYGSDEGRGSGRKGHGPRGSLRYFLRFTVRKRVSGKKNIYFKVNSAKFIWNAQPK